jgi:hypothetical protein
VKQKEPFLGIGDTEMFNRVQDYRSNIDDLRVTPGSSGK